MSNKRKRILLLAVCIMLAVFGCGQDGSPEDEEPEDGLVKLGKVVVLSREEGSGTRSTFAGLAEFCGENEGQVDLTRKDAVVMSSAEEVIEEVKHNKSAIGYVSKGALGQAEKVKIMDVNGVSVQDEKGKYPLSRSFYLAYSGEVSDLEQDFLTYVHSAGQEIVGRTYEQVAKSNTFLSNKESGTIRIQGSTSVAPLMKMLAAGYMEQNPNSQIIVEATDTVRGLTAVLAGECDLGMSSRELSGYEKELLNYETIAKDDIAIIVNTENPINNNITLYMLKGIYTGGVENWKELE